MKRLPPLSEMERIEQTQLVEKLDEILERIDNEDIGFVITPRRFLENDVLKHFGIATVEQQRDAVAVFRQLSDKLFDKGTRVRDVYKRQVHELK